MDLKARVEVNCGRKDGRKTGRLYLTLLKQVRQKMTPPDQNTTLKHKQAMLCDFQQCDNFSCDIQIILHICTGQSDRTGGSMAWITLKFIDGRCDKRRR